MSQLPIKNLFQLAPFAGGPCDLPHKFHLYLINYLIDAVYSMGDLEMPKVTVFPYFCSLVLLGLFANYIEIQNILLDLFYDKK